MVAELHEGPNLKRPSREKVPGGYYADEEKGRKENRKEKGEEVSFVSVGFHQARVSASRGDFLFTSKVCVKFGNRSPSVVEST